jgi:hypothetical protein
MNSITEVQRDKAANAVATSYTVQPNGSVAISWTPPGKRRRSKILTGSEAASFLAHLDKYRTKTGKVPPRISNNAIIDLLAPAPDYQVGTTNGSPVSVTKIREGFLTFTRDIPARKAKAFAEGYSKVKEIKAEKRRKAALAELCAPLF